MEIEIVNQQKRIPLQPRQIKKIVKKILTNEGIRHASLSLVFVTDRKIKALNKKYLNRDHVTDVLAFNFIRPEVCGGKRRMDGEIVISAVSAYHNAKVFKTTPYEEILLYIIHGILHLLGYDDHSVADRKRMRKKEKEIFDKEFLDHDL